MRPGWAAFGFLLIVVGIILMASGTATFGSFNILGQTFDVSAFALAIGGLAVFIVGLALPGGKTVLVIPGKTRVRTVVTCPGCGRFVSRRAKYCPNCGRRLKP